MLLTERWHAFIIKFTEGIMNFISAKKVIIYSLAMLGFIASDVSADVVISGTRVIYPAQAKEVTVKLDNRGEKALLVQAWMDDGREDINPQEMKIPFLVTPPISRMNAKQGQTVKIASLGADLPKDKESVFWFNVLEIPPKAKNTSDENLLQLAFRTRIKLFYRPEGLKGSSSEAATALTWKIIKKDKQVFAEVKNASPYFVTVNEATLNANNSQYAIEKNMISPASIKLMKVEGLSNPVSAGKITYSAISDYGGNITHAFSL
nr:fimbrial chaperone [Rahnella aquatilis]